jgi:hypothetical protein
MFPPGVDRSTGVSFFMVEPGADCKSRSMSDIDEVLTAFHESGHLTGYVAQNLADQIDYATIRPHGHCFVFPGWRSIIETSTCCMTGPAAEARYLNVPIGTVLRTSGCTDLEKTRQYLARYHEPDWCVQLYDVLQKHGRVPTIEDIARRAEALIDEHWAAVRRLAVALLKHGRIDGAMVRRVLDPLSFSARAENEGARAHSRRF